MPKFILKSASESADAAKIREAIGAGPNEEVQVTTPQFTRPKGEAGPAAPPADREAFDALRTLPETALLELGFRKWGRREDGRNREVGPMLWLLPGEWYQAIPEGYPLTCISFREETFQLGVTDNDIRFGCLAYGIFRDGDTGP
jgi:hypothetical protein